METQAQKFTPAPWKWHIGIRDRGIGKGNSIYEFLWNEKTRSSVLAVNYHMSEGDVWQAWVSIKPENARLIAAAPTMYNYLTILAERGDNEAREIIRAITNV